MCLLSLLQQGLNQLINLLKSGQHYLRSCEGVQLGWADVSCQALAGVGAPYPIVIQRAENLLGVLGRLQPHGAIAEVPPELVQGDQTAWTLVHELSDNDIL